MRRALRLVPLRLLAASLLLLAAPPALVGCGGGEGTTTETYTCTPACPTGTTCTAAGCVLDGLLPDLAVSGDLSAAGCSPACAGGTPYCNDQRQCVPCLVDDNCPTGQVCKQLGGTTACVSGCGDDARCGKGQPGQDLRCCGGRCIDAASDADNCGACGTTCSGTNAQAFCNAGVCDASRCNDGWGDCNKDGSDGCEVNLLADAANCTACGTSCKLPHAVAGCGGACYVKACEFGFDDCNGTVNDGCETSVLNDARNCGACGNSCPAVPHAKPTCINASCQLASCDQGFADCNGDPKDGCEVQVATDLKNCGGCGLACPQGLVCKNGGCTCPQCNFPNATSQCLNNQCVLDKCIVGYADCNGDPKDGCEVDLDSSAQNCSACGMACDKGLSCIAGVCVAFRKNILLCGQSNRSPLQFIPQGMMFTLVNSCKPDQDTQAIFFTRNWNNGINGPDLQAYVDGGGIVLTEYNISHTIYNLVFNAGAAMGARNGNCQDVIPSGVQFSLNDPFWQDNKFVVQANSGCGYAVGAYAGITPILGWNQNAVAVGYRDYGSGRVWATDFDWSDGENFPYDYTNGMMGYMLTHRR